MLGNAAVPQFPLQCRESAASCFSLLEEQLGPSLAYLSSPVCTLWPSCSVMCLAGGELWHGVASVAQGKFSLGKGSIFLLSGGCLLG